MKVQRKEFEAGCGWKSSREEAIQKALKFINSLDPEALISINEGVVDIYDQGDGRGWAVSVWYRGKKEVQE